MCLMPPLTPPTTGILPLLTLRVMEVMFFLIIQHREVHTATVSEDGMLQYLTAPVSADFNRDLCVIYLYIYFIFNVYFIY